MADNQPSPWEVMVVAEMRPIAEYLAGLTEFWIPYPSFEDRVQLTLIAVVRATRKEYQRYGSDPNFGYVYTAILNELRDRKRAYHARRRNLGVGVEYDEVVHPIRCQRSTADNRLQAQKVLSLLERHGVDMEILKLWGAGVTAAEGGEALSIAPGTFRNRVSEARKKARDIMKRETLYPK